MGPNSCQFHTRSEFLSDSPSDRHKIDSPATGQNRKDCISFKSSHAIGQNGKAR